VKVTERVLKDACIEANRDILRSWRFGLKVERRGNGFMLSRLFRKAGTSEDPLLAFPMAAKETMCFIEGFTTAAALANEMAGRIDDGDPETAS
jgi:hypothetical protein